MDSCQLLQLAVGQSCRGMLQPYKMADASCGRLASLALGGSCRGVITPIDDQVRPWRNYNMEQHRAVNCAKTVGGRTLCTLHTSSKRIVRLGSLQGLYERFLIINLTRGKIF